ncbi:MAG TPA: hypothetical protein H9898_01750, partial [Candidatus Anaerobiospirillum stercoravium]|nr:hypothetical protein [Candidatus Anaerobiospirillum stercoravium]
MNNNLDSKLQRPLESSPERLSKASLKALGNATPAQGTAQTAPRPALNRPATTQYLNQIAHEQDEVGEALARSINRVNQGLSQASYAPDDADAPVDAQAKSMAVYTKLAGKLIDRDQGLQNRVAHNLSESNHPIKAKDAAHSLQQAMERLPERLQEGTTSGKELAKFMVQNLVQLADTKNMGAGLERDLAMRQISVPQHQVSPRMQQANAKVLAASINYIKQNQPEVLDQLTKQPQPEPKPSAQSQQQPTHQPAPHQPAPQQAQSTISDAELEGKTYLDIFKQRSAQGVNQGIPFAPQGKGGAYDRMSAEISQRIHELITKAASNAKSGNLIRLSPEEAENFDRTVSAARERAQGEHGTRLQSMLDRATTDQQKARAAQGPDGTLPPSTTTKATQAEAVRGLSLSELSARAAKLQQQFREERQRIVSEGKLPNPAQLPETKFDAPKAAASQPTPESQARQQALSNVENNTRQLMAALAQAKAALASKIAHGVPPDAMEQEGTIPTKPEAVATKAAEPNAKAPAQASTPLPESKVTADAKAPAQPSSEPKPAPETKPAEAKPTPAPAAESAKPLDLSLLKNTTLNVSYQAVQSTLYGDLDVIPGMTIPVSHFGDLQNEVITPNDKAIEILKAQARVLAAQQQAQASNNLTELVASTKTAAQPNQAQAAAQQILSEQSQQPAQPTPAQPAPQVVTSGPQQAAAQVAQQAQAAAQQLQAQQTPAQQAAQQAAQSAPQVVTSGPQQAAAQVAEQAQAAAQQLQSQQTQPQPASQQPAQAAPQVVTSGPQQAAAQVAEQAQAAAQQLQAQQTPTQQASQQPAQQPAQSASQVVTSGPQQAAAQVAAEAQAAAQQLQAQQTPAQQAAQSAPQVVTSGPQQAAAQVAE